MDITRYIGPVLAAYGPDYQASQAEWLGSHGGFSGASFWRLTTPRGTICLRRWPSGQPRPSRLQFIHAVLRHVTHGGFRLVSLPIETTAGTTYVRKGDVLWELGAWMPGQADFQGSPTREKLCRALQTLAEFHLGTASFARPTAGLAPSPDVRRRLTRVQYLTEGGLSRLSAAIEPQICPELVSRARRFVEIFPYLVGGVTEKLRLASRWKVDLQPCLRDVSTDHILYVGTRVSGIVDFGALGWENVATDVTRLLGSMVAEDREAWKVGLGAYQEVRPLSAEEMRMISVLDRSSVLLSGLYWVEWIYRDRRTFESCSALPDRLDRLLKRLEQMMINP